jgi:Protein of unknown function (DUF2505)
MSQVSFARDIACGRDRIRELLLDREFLTEFIKQRNPVEYDVSVNDDESSSTMAWVVLTEGIPGIFRRFVGDTIPIRLVITSQGSTPDQDGSVHVDLEGKVPGRLRASLTLLSDDQHPARTAVAVRGPLNISAGLISGKASDMARDHMIIPILEELVDLIEKWSAGAPA